MKLHSLRVLGWSIAMGAGAGAALGLVYAVIAGRALLYGIGTGLLLTGVICAASGLLGATEPPEGWATARRREPGLGRQGLIARIAEEQTGGAEVGSWTIAIWGVVVGGSLFGLAMAAFALV